MPDMPVAADQQWFGGYGYATHPEDRAPEIRLQIKRPVVFVSGYTVRCGIPRRGCRLLEDRAEG